MTTINLDTINWEDDYSEPDSGYDWAPAQVFIPTEDDYTGWQLYIAVNTEGEDAKLTIIYYNDGRQDGYYSSDSTPDWPMLDDLFGGRECWQNFCNDYAKKAMKQYLEESQEED